MTDCPTCHNSDPLCTSVGAPHGAKNIGEEKAAVAWEIAQLEKNATAEVNRLARRLDAIEIRIALLESTRTPLQGQY
jgi:hypothetical protein